jgi:hypothetical protein
MNSRGYEPVLMQFQNQKLPLGHKYYHLKLMELIGGEEVLSEHSLPNNLELCVIHLKDSHQCKQSFHEVESILVSHHSC